MTIVRKGARTSQDIPTEILAQLNSGQISSANLVEWLAIDALQLLWHVLQQHQREHYFATVKQQVAALKKPTINSRNACIGQSLWLQMTQQGDLIFLQILQQHTADMVRCWACYAVVADEQLSLNARFKRIYPLAADTHFGVREVAWMAMRPFIIAQLEESLDILMLWSQDDDSNIRRFATEAARPRGVWCLHIEALKQNPALAIGLLQQLHNDPARYVQDSVANWLNDASKTQPDFVQALCDQWQAQNPTAATTYIIKKALRTLQKQG